MQKSNKQFAEQTALAAAGVYLHECDEQEEGIGSTSDLLVQKARQKGENPILCGAVEEDSENKRKTKRESCLRSKRCWKSQVKL